MKSSTLRRSNLTKERVAILEELARNRKQPYDASPGVYVRESKEKELDVLWQNFKVSQKHDKSPGVYLATGFVAGAIAMLIMTTLLSFTVRGNHSNTIPSSDQPISETAKLTFIPADNNTEKEPAKTVSESYTVKSGDTLESIIIRFYGRYDLDIVEKIRVANKMTNPNMLSIGQKLTIPLD